MTPPNAARKIVVFDLGGVLIDWNPRHLYRRLFAGDEAAMEHFLTAICSPAWNEEQDRGRSLAEGTALLAARHPEHAELIEAYYGRWLEMLAGPIAGTVEILEALDRAGAPLYALSNWSAETFAQARPRYPFLGRFRDILISGEVGLIKPDPRIFRLLIDRHDIVAADAVYVDDVVKNVEAANALGFHGIHFRNPATLRDELVALGLPG
jgi:2-haloacid dehalogenase